MSYNIYRGGTFRGQALSQTAKVIQEAKADIVGIQETRSPDGVNAEELARLLGWNHHVNPGNRVILTRYEIVEEMRDGIKVKLPSGQEAYLFNLHLPSNPYQPYQLLGIHQSGRNTRTPPSSRPKPRRLKAQKKHAAGKFQRFSIRSVLSPTKRLLFLW